MQYDNTNSGVLFRNDRKETENHPDYTGTINIEGQEYWLSGWLNDKKGRKYQKLSAKRKEAKQQPRQQVRQQSIPDEDIPFN